MHIGVKKEEKKYKIPGWRKVTTGVPVHQVVTRALQSSQFSRQQGQDKGTMCTRANIRRKRRKGFTPAVCMCMCMCVPM